MSHQGNDIYLENKLEAMMEEVMEWNSNLDEAPKDGTEILIVFPSQGNVYLLVSYSKVYKCWQSKGIHKPSIEAQSPLWKLLPNPPQKEK